MRRRGERKQTHAEAMWKNRFHPATFRCWEGAPAGDRDDKKDEHAIAHDDHDVQRNAVLEELIARVFAPAGENKLESTDDSQITASPMGRNASDGNLTGEFGKAG